MLRIYIVQQKKTRKKIKLSENDKTLTSGFKVVLKSVAPIKYADTIISFVQLDVGENSIAAIYLQFGNSNALI
jgi:hypothetical protein